MNKATFPSNRLKRKTAKWIYAVFRMIMLISIGYLVLYPVIFMISSSLKPVSAYYDQSIIYIPKQFTLDFYKLAIKTTDYFNAFASTVVYEILSAVIEILVCSFIAYGLARFDF